MDVNNLFIRIKSSRLVNDSFWALLGSVLNKGLALIAGIVVARWLGKDLYGEYGVIKNALLYLAVFSTFGLGFSSTKFVADLKNENGNEGKLQVITKSAIYISVIFSGIICILTILFANQLCEYLEISSESVLIRLTGIVIVLNSLCTTQTGIISGLKDFKVLARVNLWVGVLTVIFTVGLTYFFSIYGAVFALLISNLINCLLLQRVIRLKVYQFTYPKIDIIPVLKNLIKFSCPIALQESLYTVAYWAGMIILIKLSNYGEVGLNSAAGQWAGAVLFIPGVLQNVMLSHLSSSRNDSHTSMLKKMLLINLVATFIPFCIILICTPLITSFYGASFDGLGLVLNICIAATIFRCLIQVYVQEYISMGRAWTLFCIRLGRDLLTLILTYILIVSIKNNAAFYYNLSFMIASVVCLITLIILRKK